MTLGSVMISVRFPPELGKAVKGASDEEGLTMSGWIRRLVQRETEPPRMVEVACDGLDEPLLVPESALAAITTAALPAIVRHGSVNLQLGTPRQQAGAEHPAGLIEGSGRRGEPKALPSSLELKRGYGVTTETASTLTGRTFTCVHLSVGNAASASCGTCGPLEAA